MVMKLVWKMNASRDHGAFDPLLQHKGHEEYWNWRSGFIEGEPQQVSVHGSRPIQPATLDELNKAGMIGLYRYEETDPQQPPIKDKAND